MDIKLEEICSEMYKQVREDFPDLTFSDFKEIVKTPWFCLAQSFSSFEEYRPFRMHYFGLFSIPISQTKKGERLIKQSLEKKLVTQEEHDQVMNKINKVREEHEKNS